GKLDESRALLDKLLAKHPRQVEALTERAQVDIDTGKLDSALALLRKALELQPHDTQANYSLALCLRRVGRQAEAEQVTVRVKQISEDEGRLQRIQKDVLSKPNDAALRCEAGQLLLRNGQERDA